MFDTTTTTSVDETRSLCLAFAELYPTPNVLRGVELAKVGRITWQQLGDLFERSLGSALEEVVR